MKTFSTLNPKILIDQSQSIVIKIGSALLVDDNFNLKKEWLTSLVHDIALLHKQGKKITIVSSGAIALGRHSLEIPYDKRPSDIPLDQKQAAAALGQVILSNHYQEQMQAYDIQTALVLLSPKDTEERRAHLNARATIQCLLQHQKIPIINENDTVSTQEIRFGDNDRLAARVAQMIDADLLIQLSTIDGLYDDNPSHNPSAKHIPIVEDISDDIQSMAQDAAIGISTGGMKSKLIAANIAIQAGIPMVITDGRQPNSLSQWINNKQRGTIFTPSTQSRTARKKWILGHVEIKGSVTIDDGAHHALQQGKSLLPAGVIDVQGDFNFGDPIAIITEDQQKIATGLAGYNASEVKKIMGKDSAKITEILGYQRKNAIIHRDDLVLF